MVQLQGGSASQLVFRHFQDFLRHKPRKEEQVSICQHRLNIQ